MLWPGNGLKCLSKQGDFHLLKDLISNQSIGSVNIARNQQLNHGLAAHMPILKTFLGNRTIGQLFNLTKDHAPNTGIAPMAHPVFHFAPALLQLHEKYMIIWRYAWDKKYEIAWYWYRRGREWVLILIIVGEITQKYEHYTQFAL